MTTAPRTPWATISVLSTLAAVAIVWFICAFKIIDLDIWWHIAAGRLMRATHAIISIEPFAYTREAQPYLATHEWFSQIILSNVFDLFGATGIIVLRTFLVIAALSPIVIIGWKRTWLAAPLAVFTALVMRPAILDRPQLFTFVIFSAILTLTILWTERKVRTRTFMVAVPLLQILWVNMHGAAALITFFILGALLCEIVITALKTHGMSLTVLEDTHLKSLLAVIILAGVATFISPNTTDTFTYLRSLLTDRTVQFIAEWNARDFGQYLRWFAPLWIVGLGAITIGRVRPFFSVILLGSLGLLTFQATRHEPLFALSAAIISVSQWESPRWKHLLDRICPMIAGIVLVASLIALGTLAMHVKQLYAGRFGWSGYGTYEPVKAAADFLEKENVGGKIFNTYEAGNYLLYRGQKVFIDGRNVDYGYDFLRRTINAGGEVTDFRSLEKEFGFTVAVVQFEYFAQLNPLPFASVLDGLDDWALVEIDDASAIYVKRDETHRALIEKFGYTVLRPEILIRPAQAIVALPTENLDRLNDELIRAEQTLPTSIRPRLARATLYLLAGAFDEAEKLAQQVHLLAPERYEPFDILAMVRVSQERYAEAGMLLEESIRLAGGESSTEIDTNFVADIFEKAGNTQKASYYRSLSPR